LASAAERKPNFIFILADDLGCYGHPQIKSPNLDRLAKEGTLFTQFYVNGSVCSPSHCAFFTGQMNAPLPGQPKAAVNPNAGKGKQKAQ
jgi:arylsulfatase A-like enzyme